ncbi:hypothetical protein LX36DRAFT_639340 [Colletotrichum falcatum]|nr:hypothetical protein LX36DRAFT_639340 [Colletotrichum falcatum]
MKVLFLFAYCTAVLANLGAPASNDTAVQVDDSIVNAVNEGATPGRLLSRDIHSAAYREAMRAAGHRLRPNSYYYFMNCAIGHESYQPTTTLGRWAMSHYGCSHVGLVVGKTSAFEDAFTATYIQIRLYRDGFDQTTHEYTAYEHQKLVYGGRTTSSKANIRELAENGERWLRGSGLKVTEQYNCVAHYRYLASLL